MITAAGKRRQRAEARCFFGPRRSSIAAPTRQAEARPDLDRFAGQAVPLAADVAANLVVGAAALQYKDAYGILLVAFWIEVLVVGAINVSKMLIAAALGRPVRDAAGSSMPGAGLRSSR